MAASSHDITLQCKPFMFNQSARSRTRQISLWTANKDDGPALNRLLKQPVFYIIAPQVNYLNEPGGNSS